jgi:hypothetical protein
VFSKDGFLGIRAGIFDHLHQGRFTPNAWLVYCTLLRQCNWRSGRWYGHSHYIRQASGNVMTIRQIQSAMAQLVEHRYVKSFYQQGKKGQYAVLIHKYRVPVGELKGTVLNAFKSDTYERPVYEAGCESEVIDTLSGSDVEVSLNRRGSDVEVIQDVQEAKPSNPQALTDKSFKNSKNEQSVSQSEEWVGEEESLSTKSKTQAERWQSFAFSKGAMLPDEMKHAFPTDEERDQILAQLDEIGVENLGMAIGEWVEMQSPPIYTLKYHRWQRWLQTGADKFEEWKPDEVKK